MRYVDLTHLESASTQSFPSDPAPEFFSIADLDKQGYFSSGIKACMHTGTHIDAPAHMIKGGRFLSQIGVEQFCGRGHLADARGKKTIGPEVLVGMDINPGDIVLIMTGWSKKFGQKEYFEGYPEISEKLAHYLAACGISMLGLDCPGPDFEPFLIHKYLLEKNVLILENLNNLAELLDEQFEVLALPAKFHAEAAPTRAVARILERDND